MLRAIVVWQGVVPLPLDAFPTGKLMHALPVVCQPDERQHTAGLAGYCVAVCAGDRADRGHP